jgi:glycosidase
MQRSQLHEGDLMLRLIPVIDASAQAVYEFHVSRTARDLYQFDEALFSIRGDIVFANFHATRLFAQRINEKRDLISFSEQSVQAGHLNAMGLSDEIYHFLIAQYRKQYAPHLLKEIETSLVDKFGQETLDQLLTTFIANFPPTPVYKAELTQEQYLEGSSAGTPNREILLEELLMVWLANHNPAKMTFAELFDDAALQQVTDYEDVIQHIVDFMDDYPSFGPEQQNLVTLLQLPVEASPHSLRGQLEYIRTHWFGLIGDYLYRLLASLDFLAEEEKMFFGFGPGPSHIYEFGGMEFEPENFSPDSDWMPRAVMLAKNVYVWLDQISKEYQRSITQLDQVPDEELDLIRKRGFTALWLIGLWERSTASREIKQRMGNPEAVASAYSLKRYAIATDLGGEDAFNNLKSRAWQRGIRMASDMVPNHMGIDSDWLISHPDWFISLDYSPFPAYSFSGPDLCADERVGVYLEDHYYSHSDAAVVFKRVDHWTGSEKYIYHGNDGTLMPWNDTAQLNYLHPEVREAVIQTILDVARRSPIIRFDAAMTLTKRHFQRLWFPEPGTGGDIASRADFGMTKDQFDKAMPEEFWREVVDRVAAEVPDTLLLAEAFWLMEGYFVRSLGMHRVYNSAYMNMLRDEKNAEYRQLIKNTLEFDPRILGRYVNFMNNPDERTAVEQFGKGDKYFGICALLATMPGLPMFGHGQVEGYAEKYGMEYRKAYWNETPDGFLVERHNRQIFPLLHKRYIFSGSENFLLYDFFTAGGSVDENVFAYSNRFGDERALVIYHNRYAETRGWIRQSAAFAVKGKEDEPVLMQKSLMEGLHLSGEADRYLIFRDVMGELEYIRNSGEIAERGLYVALHAYQTHVFIDFREEKDDTLQKYRQLADKLGGRGVPNIAQAVKELTLEPVYAPFRMLVSAPAFRWLREAEVKKAHEDVNETVLDQVRQKMLALGRAVLSMLVEDNQLQPGAEEESGLTMNVGVAASDVVTKLRSILKLKADIKPVVSRDIAATFVLDRWQSADWQVWGTLLGWLFIHKLGGIATPSYGGDDGAAISRTWMDEWLFGKWLGEALRDLGVDAAGCETAVTTVKLLLTNHVGEDATAGLSSAAIIRRMLRNPDIQAYIKLHRYQEILWFNKEAFESLLWWVMFIAVVEEDSTVLLEKGLNQHPVFKVIQQLTDAEEASDYRIDKLLAAL